MKTYMKLRAYIDEIGIKQKNIAEKSGIPYKKFNAMLCGRISLKADDLNSICDKGLGISPTKIFDYKIQDSWKKIL